MTNNHQNNRKRRRWIFVGVVAVRVLSGLVPALRASRLNPVEELRYE